MRRSAVVSVFVAVTLLTGTVLACGDKLLAIGRGVRFQRISVAHQANLLIYTAGTPGSPLSSARLQTSLKRAVRNLQLVQSGSELDQALKAGGVDVVLVSVTDLAAIAPRLRSAPAKPIIIPVLVQASKAEYAAAEKEFGFALRATSDESGYLTMIDQAMKMRLRTNARS